jgi:hypothetical protein
MKEGLLAERHKGYDFLLKSIQTIFKEHPSIQSSLQEFGVVVQTEMKKETLQFQQEQQQIVDEANNALEEDQIQ